jgi:hypothetical protein
MIDSINGFLDPEEGRGLYEIALEASGWVPAWRSAAIAASPRFISAAPAVKTDPSCFPSTTTGDPRNSSPAKNISTSPFRF